MDTYAADVAELVDRARPEERHPYRPFDRRRRSRALCRPRRCQGRVAKAVLIDAVPPVMVKTDVESRADCRSRCSTASAPRSPPTAPNSTSMSRPARSTASTAPARRSSQGLIDNWWRQGMMGGAKAHYDCIKAFSETDFTEDLKAIDVPVLVIHSEDDQIVPYADSAPLAVKLLKNGTLKTYKDLPHGLCPTHPDIINPDLLAFIRGEHGRGSRRRRSRRRASPPWPDRPGHGPRLFRAFRLSRGHDRATAAAGHPDRDQFAVPRCPPRADVPAADTGRDRPAAALRNAARVRRGRSAGPVGRERPRADADPVGRGRDHPAARGRRRATDRHPRPPARSWASSPSCRASRRWSPRPPRRRAKRIAIPPDRLRALLVGEAELGERIMRALILRRVGLIEAGVGGPVIVGREGDADVLRLENFLARNGHPHQRLDPDERRLRAHLDRAFQRRARGTADRAVPRRAAAAQPDRGLARPLPRHGRADRPRPSVRRRGDRRRAGRPRHRGLCRVRGARRADARLPRVRRPGRRLGADRELPRLPDRHHRHRADGAGLQPGAEVRRDHGHPRRGGEARVR